jgi:hypothetical protein
MRPPRSMIAPSFSIPKELFPPVSNDTIFILLFSHLNLVMYRVLRHHLTQ